MSIGFQLAGLPSSGRRTGIGTIPPPTGRIIGMHKSISDE
jgi:hypothetical protein